MPRMTHPRAAVLCALESGPRVLSEILAALGFPEDFSRGTYARGHRVVMSLVREEVVECHKNRHHYASTFALTPAGRSWMARYQREHVSLLPAEFPRPVSPPAIATVPSRNSLGSEPMVKCPECGDAVSLSRARALIEGGAKVTCGCSNDLTILAQIAIEKADLS